MRKLGEQWVEDGRMYKAVRQIGALIEKKYLGPVNGDGCLAEERTGLFPVITGLESEKCWVVRLHAGNVTITVSGNTKQQAIDAWNRRV